MGALRPDIGPAVEAALRSVAAHPRLSGKVALGGMAFGGFLALRAAASVRALAGVVSINGFFDLGGSGMRCRRSIATTCASRSAARTFANGPTVSPWRAAIPALILHGGRDKIFSPSEAVKCADICVRGAELHVFEDGNHVCNNIPWLYRPLVADWVAERLGA